MTYEELLYYWEEAIKLKAKDISGKFFETDVTPEANKEEVERMNLAIYGRVKRLSWR